MLANVVVGSATTGGLTLTATQQTCVRAAITGLSPADQSTLLAGLAVPTALGDIQTALLGRITEGVLQRCGVSVPGVESDTTVTT